MGLANSAILGFRHILASSGGSLEGMGLNGRCAIMNCMPRIIDPRPVDIVQWSQEFSQLYNQFQAPQVTDYSGARYLLKILASTQPVIQTRDVSICEI